MVIWAITMSYIGQGALIQVMLPRDHLVAYDIDPV
jgi:hypothetical protein